MTLAHDKIECPLLRHYCINQFQFSVLISPISSAGFADEVEWIFTARNRFTVCHFPLHVLLEIWHYFPFRFIFKKSIGNFIISSKFHFAICFDRRS